ncbi:MAG: SGNH/GDSL hydrolase family protein [Lachnospiraceae bacterium]|nr:SGNH/GDSL hydrolase family protein [Lachnospiraceae bacterium]
MKTILCFGDSNTFGTNPAGGRHPRHVRWTGRLQKLLGEDYYVIEEGMGGRTTVWDDPLEPNRNGLRFLPVALQSHQPLDMVILSLGTNDCKTIFQAEPRVIAAGIGALCDEVLHFPYREGYPIPKILIVSPIHIGDAVKDSIYITFDRSSAVKSHELSSHVEKVAGQRNCLFVDASQVAVPGQQDQLHMDEESHRALAEKLYEVIQEYFKSHANV